MLAVFTIKPWWRYSVNYNIDTILESMVKELEGQKELQDDYTENDKSSGINETNMTVTIE